MSATGANTYLAYVKAAAGNPSAIPPTPAMQKVNWSSIDMGTEIDTSVSENANGTRRNVGVAITGFNITGGYDFEMTFDNSTDDMIMAAMLWGTWEDNLDGTFTLKDGAVYQPFFFERGHVDVSEYFQFMGMAANTWTMNISDGAPVTGNYQFVGLGSDVIQTPTPDATYTDATENPVISSITNIPIIRIDGVEQTGCIIKEFGVEVNNNVTPKTGVGTLGACATNPHRIEITGALTMYFEDSAMYQRLIAGTEFALEWQVIDNIGNEYLFTLPRVMLDADSIPVDGADADIMDDASYVALDDSVSGSVMTVVRTPHV